MKYLIIYLIIINLISAVVTVWDKRSAELGRRRVSERSLFILAALGGAPLMYLTMLTISHKTRKARFMLGIPLIFLAELAAFLVMRYVFKII